MTHKTDSRKVLVPRSLTGRAAGGQGGYTIVEVLAAVGIVGVTFASVLSGFSFAFQILQTARENLRATQIAQDKMETIRLYSWDQINTPGFIPPNFTASANPTNTSIGTLYSGTLTITNAPVTEGYSTNLRQVLVDLTWKSGKVDHHRSMTTFISRYGLQNYVY